jgi:HAD superfamily hydrolase (TIGR01450 family)
VAYSLAVNREQNITRSAVGPADPVLRRLGQVRHIVLDMDGTIYLGGTLLPVTGPFLHWLKGQGIGYTFLTNNNALGRRQYIEKLAAMGLAADASSLFLSTDATIHHLRHHLPRVSRLYILGTKGLREDLAAADYEASEDRPQAVVVGYDTELTYERLCGAAYWISRGLPFIATHPDRVCPTDRPTVLPDCGAICALLETATGRRPEAICGKPQPVMLEAVLERHGLRPDEAAMVGDRIYTDMEMAHRVGCLAVLVLSGETTADIAATSNADLVVRDIGELHQLLEQARRGA